MLDMTYARSRLCLGIFGVGSIVLVTLAGLIGGLPHSIFSTSKVWSPSDFSSLALFELTCVAYMLPLDLLGGFFLPRLFGRQNITANDFVRRWLTGVLFQATLFLVVGLLIVATGRFGGRFAVISLIIIIAVGFIAFQRRITLWMTRGLLVDTDEKVVGAMEQTKQWGFKPLPAIVVEHQDPGFTGGVVGLPRFESLILSRSWVDQLSSEQLSVAIARRLEAVNTGSRTRGILLALIWISSGFAIASHLPGAGFTSIAELVMTCLGFTSWTFIGLLVLPTVSRQATYAIDRNVILRGVPSKLLRAMLKKLDRLQDDEPLRSTMIETIFHPVPSIANRSASSGNASLDSVIPFAWHSPRMMLFLSWSCLGLLARAVHCNVGRPELWIMLPTD